MTSVGYGDIGPQNVSERVVCTLIAPWLRRTLFPESPKT